MKKNILLAAFFFVYTLFTNCTQDEAFIVSDRIEDQANNTYLSLVPVKSAMDKFKNQQILEEADKRISPYLKIDNGRIVLTLKSGKALNISDEIFQMYINGTKINNALLEKGEIYIYKNKLYYYTSSCKFPRLKRNTWEGKVDKPYENDKEKLPNGSTRNRITCKDPNSVIAYCESQKDIPALLYTLLYFAANGKDEAITAPLSHSFHSACEQVYWLSDAKENSIYRAIRNGGITIISIHYPTLPYNNTTQHITQIYDNDMTLLCLF